MELNQKVTRKKSGKRGARRRPITRASMHDAVIKFGIASTPSAIIDTYTNLRTMVDELMDEVVQCRKARKSRKSREAR